MWTVGEVVSQRQVLKDVSERQSYVLLGGVGLPQGVQYLVY